jgi:hypothetical protein
MTATVGRGIFDRSLMIREIAMLREIASEGELSDPLKHSSPLFFRIAANHSRLTAQDRSDLPLAAASREVWLGSVGNKE